MKHRSRRSRLLLVACPMVGLPFGCSFAWGLSDPGTSLTAYSLGPTCN